MPIHFPLMTLLVHLNKILPINRSIQPIFYGKCDMHLVNPKVALNNFSVRKKRGSEYSIVKFNS